MQVCYTGEKTMSHSHGDHEKNDILEIAAKNPKVDAEKVQEARKLLQVLRAHGVSPQEYNLIPPFRRQIYVDSKYGNAES